jgi:hypothetical protein
MGQWGLAEWEGLIAILGALINLLTLCFVLYLKSIFVTRPEIGDLLKKLNERVENHAQRLTNGDSRFVRLESRIEQVPSIDAVNALAISLERLNGDVRVVSGQLKGYEALHDTLKHQVELMDEFMRRSDT